MGASPQGRRRLARLASSHDQSSVFAADAHAPAHCSPTGVALNPDVFITIVFGGIAALVAVSVLLFVVARVARGEPRRKRRASGAEGSEHEQHGPTAKPERSASVH
jgi:hypothetical protein